MARIKDKLIKLELVPRKYFDFEEDPFILSYFELCLNNKVIFRDFSALLLKSEYELFFKST